MLNSWVVSVEYSTMRLDAQGWVICLYLHVALLFYIKNNIVVYDHLSKTPLYIPYHMGQHISTYAFLRSHSVRECSRCSQYIQDKRIIAIIRKELLRIIKYIIETKAILTEDELGRLLLRFDVENVRVCSTNSYTVHKLYMNLCIRDKQENLKPHDQILHEAIHLLAHLTNREIMHGPIFWNIKERLMRCISETSCIDLEIARKTIAAKRIQRKWRECISCPHFHICQRRLQNEWREMI